ncbi:MAG: thiol peroxidase [Chlamydiota bacterium]
MQILFKGNPIHTYGNLPQVGTKAPPFTLTNRDLKDVTLQDFAKGKKFFYFVPSIATSICSKSGKDLGERAKEKPEVSFVVVSADLPFAQSHYCEQESIPNLIMLSTFRFQGFGETYGILIKDGPVAGLLARAILVLDENNEVLFEEIVPEMSDFPNFDKPFSLL